MGWGRRSLELIRRPGLSELQSVAAWRRRLLDLLSLLVALAMPVALAISTPHLLEQGLGVLVVIDVLVWLWVVHAVFRRAEREHGRGVIVVVVAFVLSAQFLLTLGPTHARGGWLVAVGVLAGLFVGPRAALLAALANAALLVVLHATLGPEAPGWEHEYDGSARWTMFVVNISFLTTLVAVPIGLLLRGLEEVLAREQETRRALELRNRELEESQVRLRHEGLLRARLEESLHQARRFETLGRQAGGAIHDLKNALLPIRGYAELAQELVDSPDQLGEHLDKIVAATARADELARQALVLRPAETEPSEPVALDRLVRELARSLAPTLPPGIRLELDLDAEGQPVRGEPTALFQVLLNLVTNSIASLQEREGNILLTTAAEDGEVRITVSDEGCGMDEETLAHAFEPLHSTHGDEPGLGLAISQSIVTGLGGSIALRSQRNEGTTVEIRIPSDRSAA